MSCDTTPNKPFDKDDGMARSGKTTALPFGLWTSPISGQDLTRGVRSFGHRESDGDWLYWTESRPDEKGRQVIMRSKIGGAAEELLPQPFSARSRVHEYGGAEFSVARGIVYFVNDTDQDVWTLLPGHPPERLTREPTTRFAAMAHDTARERVIAVAERQAQTSPKNGHTTPENLLVAIGLAGHRRGAVESLIEGHDFYAFPTVSPDGGRLAFLAWNLPDMPWDQSALYVAPLRADGGTGRAKRIAGGKGVAAMQPHWLHDGRLVVLTDASGWGNLALWEGDSVRNLTTLKHDLGVPMWNLGTRSFVIDDRGRIHAAASVDGRPVLVTVSKLEARRPVVETTPLAGDIASVGSLAAVAGGIAATLGHHRRPAALSVISGTRKAPAILRTSSDMTLAPANVSLGRQVQFQGGDRRTTYARYYAPASERHTGPRGARPPALVLAHGGPTSAAGRGFGLRTQFYTSRGFAVIDVDYAGSTGYGRAYRERLDGNWGIADVKDCAAAAAWAGREGLVDPDRIAIAGGSAGGYTVLMVLATTQGVFAAGSSHYGISDLALLMEHTHKFEAGYLHRLMGTTPRNWRKVCDARSPLTLIEGMRAPVILFQGLDDRVVPPEQSRRIAERLRVRGIRAELHEFAGEGHGFRRADTIIAVFEAELAFLRSALRLE